MAQKSKAERNRLLKILELEDPVTDDDVKKTYKQLALKYHPDKNPDDPYSTAKFQELSKAYYSLSTKYCEKNWCCCPYHGECYVWSDEDEEDLYEDDESLLSFCRHIFVDVLSEFVFRRKMSIKCKKYRCFKVMEDKHKTCLVCTKCSSSHLCGLCAIWAEDIWSNVLQLKGHKKSKNKRTPVFTEEEEEEDSFFDTVYKKYCAESKEYVLTEEDLRKFHSCDEWLKDRDPKKRHNLHMRRAKKRANSCIPQVDQVKTGSKRQLLAVQHKRQKEMKEIAEQISKTQKEKRGASVGSQQRHHSSQYDNDTEDAIMQELEEQTTRKRLQEEALQAKLQKMDAIQRHNEKKKKRKDKKMQKKQQRWETQKKAAERSKEELDEAADNGISTFPEQRNELSNMEADKENGAKMNAMQASKPHVVPAVINKESKSSILVQHFTPNYVSTGIKRESRSSILEKQFNFDGKSFSGKFWNSPRKEDPTAASLLQHHLKQYEELMKVQPARHTEQQLKVEREQLHLEQIQKDQEELERLRKKRDDNRKALGRRSPEGSVVLPEFQDEKQLEKLRQQHLQQQRQLELLRNQEETYEIQQNSRPQVRQQKVKQEAPKWYQRDMETARNHPQNPSIHTPGKEATPPVVNVWSMRKIMQEKKQHTLEEIIPKSQEDEEEMLKQALELSKLTAKEEKERFYKHIARKGESNTTGNVMPPRSTLVPPFRPQDQGGLQSIWDIDVSKSSPFLASTSVSHNPASQLSPTYAESVKPKSTGPSWTLPLSPLSTSSLNSLPSPTYAELVKPRPISPVTCPFLTAHSEQGIISRQQSVNQYQNQIHQISTWDNQQEHVALNCNNSASFSVESNSKMGSSTRPPWEHPWDFGTKCSHQPTASVIPPIILCKSEKQDSEQPSVPLMPPRFVFGSQQHDSQQGLAPLVPPSFLSSQQQGIHQRPISSRLPYFIPARQKQEEGTQIYSDEKVSAACGEHNGCLSRDPSVRVEAWNPSLDKRQENDAYRHTSSVPSGSSTKLTPSFCGKQPEYSMRQQDLLPQKTHLTVQPPSNVEGQERIGQSFSETNAIIFPTIQNSQHNMEVDMQSARVNDDWKTIEEDWDAEVDEVLACRKPFIEDLGRGRKKLWSCKSTIQSTIQEKTVFPCRRDFATVFDEFKVRKEKQEPKLCEGEPDKAEHTSELCQEEGLVKGSSMSGFGHVVSALASRRMNTVGKGGFKQRSTNRNTSELNKNHNRIHENKDCDTGNWSSTKSQAFLCKSSPKETFQLAREINKLDRSKLNKNNLSSDCDTTDLSPQAQSTLSNQEPRIPPNIKQNNLPTKRAPLRQSGKPIPFFPQTESWDDEIDRVPYIQADLAPKQVIPNGEYLNQDMLANQFSCSLSMEEAESETINNKTTDKRLDAREKHDSSISRRISSSENKTLDTEIGQADVLSRFQFEKKNKNYVGSGLESNQFWPQKKISTEEMGDRFGPTRLPHFAHLLNVTSSAMSLGLGFTTTKPKSTTPEFIDMNSVQTESSGNQTSESKTLNGQSDSISRSEGTEATKASETNHLNSLPSGLPPHLVQAYLQYLAQTSLNPMNMAAASLMPGTWPDLGIIFSPFCPNMCMYPHSSMMNPRMPVTSPVFSYSPQQQLHQQQKQKTQQHEVSVNETSNEFLSQSKTEIGNIAADQQDSPNDLQTVQGTRGCPVIPSEELSQIEETNSQSSAAIHFDNSQTAAKIHVDSSQYGVAVHVDNSQSAAKIHVDSSQYGVAVHVDNTQSAAGMNYDLANLTLTRSRNQFRPLESKSGWLQNGGQMVHSDSNMNNVQDDSQATPKTDGPRPFYHPRPPLSITRICDMKNSSSSEKSSNTCSEYDSQGSNRKISLPPRLQHIR